jgi:crotonobetainyl-CoA:carnitine CoA-transferase CaiB-like acyl-CoA transferase
MAVEPGGPLAGVTVLEVGAFMAAPFATMQLADLGARVLKVENPTGGDPVRATGPFLDGESSPFVRLNRNKESVALDLKSPEGKQAFLRLAARADVLVENLRPGAMRGLGFDYEAIREVNPRIVYASASGWGQDGPLAALPGLDIMAQARGGLMSITGTRVRCCSTSSRPSSGACWRPSSSAT